MQDRRAGYSGRGWASSGRIGLAAVLALAAGLTAPGAARAGDLFEAVSAEEARLARLNASEGADALPQILMRLNRDVLARHMAPLNMDRERGRLQQARSLDGMVNMTLKPGLAVALKRSGIDRVQGGGYLWSADVLEGGGTGSFLIEDGQLLGRVQVGGKVYMIEPVGDVLHRITEVDPAQIPGDMVVPAPAPAGAPLPTAAGKSVGSTGGTAKITYLVAYTAKARKASSNIEKEIKFAIAWSNKAFENSGVKIKFKLVKMMEAKNYDENSTSYGGNLSDLSFGAPLAKVRRQRDKKGADLVSLIREGGSFCGIGYLAEQPSAFTADWGYSVSSRGICLPLTFPHEAGHNMGLNHDRFVEPSAPKSQYNFGYVNVSAAFQTIMAYQSQCAAAGKFCKEIQYFSTPKKKYKGKKVGKPAGKNGAADSARKLNENRGAIAAYR